MTAAFERHLQARPGWRGNWQLNILALAYAGS